jgi:hypothetical protein
VYSEIVWVINKSQQLTVRENFDVAMLGEVVGTQ